MELIVGGMLLGNQGHIRKSPRFVLAAPVWFKWQTDSGTWREGRGITRDMSGNGLFVLAYPVPVPGASLVVTVEMPSLSLLKKPVVIRGQGRVVRIEPQDGQPIGFAAQVLFEDSDEEPVERTMREDCWPDRRATHMWRAQRL